MRLHVLEGTYAVARLDPHEKIPEWTVGSGFLSITRTTEELSIVCEDSRPPMEIRCQRGWKCLAVEGPLDFSMTSVMAALAQPLSAAKIAVLGIATFVA